MQKRSTQAGGLKQAEHARPAVLDEGDHAGIWRNMENLVVLAYFKKSWVDKRNGTHVVNSRGGATLLKTPELIFTICKAVRDATPIDTPVTAKVRLGFDDDSQFNSNSNFSQS